MIISVYVWVVATKRLALFRDKTLQIYWVKRLVEKDFASGLKWQWLGRWAYTVLLSDLSFYLLL